MWFILFKCLKNFDGTITLLFYFYFLLFVRNKYLIYFLFYQFAIIICVYTLYERNSLTKTCTIDYVGNKSFTGTPHTTHTHTLFTFFYLLFRFSALCLLVCWPVYYIEYCDYNYMLHIFINSIRVRRMLFASILFLFHFFCKCTKWLMNYFFYFLLLSC